MRLEVRVLCLVATFCQAQFTNLPNNRIQGGESVDVAEIPYQVAIVHIDGYQVCGGSIITVFHVLTAAHCAITFPYEKGRRRKFHTTFQRRSTTYDPPSSFLIFAGATDLRNPQAVRSVRYITPHDKYNIQKTGFDIAIMMVDIPFLWSTQVYKIPLSPPNFEVYDPIMATVSGYGITYPGETGLIYTLQRVEVWVISNDYCRLFYPDESDQPILESEICTYCWQGKGACVGDSGGPVVVDGMLVGIVAWGIDDCANQDFPTGNTRVSSYLDWIEGTIDIQMRHFMDLWGWQRSEHERTGNFTRIGSKHEKRMDYRRFFNEQ